MKIIKCPSCKQLQLMERAPDSGIFFPVSPFCCEVMYTADSPRWNKFLDDALDEVDEICLDVPKAFLNVIKYIIA